MSNEPLPDRNKHQCPSTTKFRYNVVRENHHRNQMKPFPDRN